MEDPAALVSSLSFSWNPLSLRGGIQIWTDLWGVFEDDRFEVVLRNPLFAPAKVTLSIDADRQPDLELAPTERRSVGGLRRFSTDKNFDNKVSLSVSRFDITTIFEPSQPPFGGDPEIAAITVINLGAGRIGKVSGKAIQAAADAAERAVLEEYLNAFGPDEWGRALCIQLINGVDLEDAAMHEGIELDIAESIRKEHQKTRNQYLDAMVAGARKRVETLLRSTNSKP